VGEQVANSDSEHHHGHGRRTAGEIKMENELSSVSSSIVLASCCCFFRLISDVSQAVMLVVVILCNMHARKDKAKKKFLATALGFFLRSMSLFRGRLI
jgi:hypothetical protein